jgi:hypothetical protein
MILENFFISKPFCLFDLDFASRSPFLFLSIIPDGPLLTLKASLSLPKGTPNVSLRFVLV